MRGRRHCPEEAPEKKRSDLKGGAAGDGPEPKGRGRSDLDKFIWEDVRIDEIKEGDEILTLDEKTGHFVWQKVEKTMDKGIQATFELTTASGKKIETTGDHPYLVMPRIQELNSNILFDSAFQTIKRVSHNFYFNVLAKWDPFVPSLGEKIEISRVGWDHLHEKIRSKFDNMARYFALPKIIAILQDPEIEPIYERGRDKIKDIEFWHFSAIVDGVAVKLILRSIRGERKHLYSIMWKGEVSGHANGRADQKKELSLAYLSEVREWLPFSSVKSIPSLSRLCQT